VSRSDRSRARGRQAAYRQRLQQRADHSRDLPNAPLDRDDWSVEEDEEQLEEETS
jgi:hypothetical protein